MENWLKSEADRTEVSAADVKVRASVEQILADIETRGDAAVRDLSIRFDGWDRTDYRLTASEIEACMAELDPGDLDDIRFAQSQVRRFAEHQRGTMTDLEVETLPGVILGHKNIPIGSAGCYVPRRQVPAARVRPHVGHHGEGRWRAPRGHLRAADQGAPCRRYCGRPAPRRRG